MLLGSGNPWGPLIIIIGLPQPLGCMPNALIIALICAICICMRLAGMAFVSCE